jgi:mannose-6-phosphate isomerase-like protein (cupin superfamily)
MAIWKKKLKIKSKPWGSENRSSNAFHFGAKVIHLKKGHRTSLKRVNTKNQTFMCISGLVKVQAPEESEFSESCEFILHEGEELFVEKGNAFRLEALQDSVLIEISDHSKVENLQGIDMIEDDYGRKGIHPGIVNLKI